MGLKIRWTVTGCDFQDITWKDLYTSIPKPEVRKMWLLVAILSKISVIKRGVIHEGTRRYACGLGYYTSVAIVRHKDLGQTHWIWLTPTRSTLSTEYNSARTCRNYHPWWRELRFCPRRPIGTISIAEATSSGTINTKYVCSTLLTEYWPRPCSDNYLAGDSRCRRPPLCF